MAVSSSTAVSMMSGHQSPSKLPASAMRSSSGRSCGRSSTAMRPRVSRLVVRAGPSPSVGSKVDGLGLPTDEPESVESLNKLGEMQMNIEKNTTTADGISGTATMNFDGPVPERVNGRLAMLGFTAALGAELANHTPVSLQFDQAPGAIALTVATIAVGTAISVSDVGRKALKFGPFNPRAELINGRAAMLGFAALLAAEVINGGHSLF